MPINVTLLFSREQYLAAAEAYLRGIERRIAAGLDPKVALGRVAVRQPLGQGGQGQGAAGAAQPARHRDRQADLQGLPRAARLAALAQLAAAGARPQRLLWASTGTKDPRRLGHALHRGAGGARHHQHHAGEDLARLRRPRHGRAARCRPTAAMPRRCSRAFAQAGVDDRRARRRSCSARAPQAFVKSWQELLQRIADEERGADDGSQADARRHDRAERAARR